MSTDPNPDPRLPDELADLRARGDGYRHPDEAYFERLADSVLDRARRPARVRKLPRRWLALAASLALMVVALVFLLPGADSAPGTLAGTPPAEPTATHQDPLANLDPALIDAYITDHLEDFETVLYSDTPLN